MLKNTPKYLISQATTLPTKLCGSKKRWLPASKIKLTWEKIIYSIARNGELTPFFIIPRSIWDHCPISSGISNTILLNVCGGCQETGAFWTSALWDIVKYWKRCQISTSVQSSCYGVEFRFKCIADPPINLWFYYITIFLSITSPEKNYQGRIKLILWTEIP